MALWNIVVRDKEKDLHFRVGSVEAETFEKASALAAGRFQFFVQSTTPSSTPAKKAGT